MYLKEVISFRNSLIYLKNPKIILTAFLDFILILIYGAVSGVVFEKIQDRAFQAVNAAGQDSAQIVQELAYNPNILGILRQNPGVEDHLRVIVFLILGLMLFVYLTYCLSQGINWKFTFDMTEKKNKNYLKKFFLVNLFWFSIFYVFQIFDFIRILSESLQGGYDYAFPLTPGAIFFIIVYSIIGYFALISYVLVRNQSPKEAIKNSFVIGIGKIKQILSMYAVLLVVFLAFDLILRFAFNIHQFLWIIVGVFVLFAISWARIYVNLSVEKIA